MSVNTKDLCVMGKSCVRWVERFSPQSRGIISGDKNALAVRFFSAFQEYVGVYRNKSEG